MKLNKGLMITLDWLNYLQWPAMVITVTAAWMAGSQKKYKRMIGFWSFFAGNLLWMIWGIHDKAWALVMLQVFLAVINIRGAKKNTSEESKVELQEKIEKIKS